MYIYIYICIYIYIYIYVYILSHAGILEEQGGRPEVAHCALVEALATKYRGR